MKTISLRMLVFFIAALVSCSQAVAIPPASDLKDSQKKSGGDAEALNTMLHSLALYMLASEVLAYYKDGSADAQKLQQKYADHPGWIPAFSKSFYVQEEETLFVPLGQCLLKVQMDVHGQMQFALVHPRDPALSDADRNILLMHLFHAMNESDIRRDPSRALRDALAADSLVGLSKPTPWSGCKPSKGNKPSPSKTKEEITNSL